MSYRRARFAVGSLSLVALSTVMARPAAAAPYPGAEVGRAAQARGRVPRYDRYTGDQDWVRPAATGAVAADGEAAVPDFEWGPETERGDWEALIERHQAAREADAKAARARRRKPPRLPSADEVLDQLRLEKPSPSVIKPEIPWTTGGFRPSRAYHKAYGPKGDRLSELLAERIPKHLDPIDLRSRDAFGEGIIEVAEALKAAIAEDGAGLQEAFTGGPYEARELIVKSRAPNFFLHDYGVGMRFQMLVRGLYRSQEEWDQPLNFKVDLDVLAGEDGLVRADIRPDWETSEWAAGGAPPHLDHDLLAASRHVANAFGPRELQGIEARIRDLVRRVLPRARPAPGRVIPNHFRQEAYVPIALKTATFRGDLDGDGEPDATFHIKNRVRRVERRPVRRGERPRFDFRQHVGWELRRGEKGEELLLARGEGRVKFALYGDTDGDGLPDLTLVEDRVERQAKGGCCTPDKRYFFRPAVYFLDGQDMAREVFELGCVRFDFPPGSDGSEIRAARLNPRWTGSVQPDWDVELELFDPLGRVVKKGLVFDRYPSNRKCVEEVGYQRADFAGARKPLKTRGIKFRVNFPLGGTALDAAAKKIVTEAVKKVRTGQVLRVRLVGHACAMGSYEKNLELGRRRAAAVRSVLAECGVDPKLVKIESRGEYLPIDTNTVPEAAARNRRVDGWIVVRDAPASKPPWYGRIGVGGKPKGG